MNKVTESSQFLASFVLRCCLQYTGEWGHGTRGVAHNKGNELAMLPLYPRQRTRGFSTKLKQIQCCRPGVFGVVRHLHGRLGSRVASSRMRISPLKLFLAPPLFLHINQRVQLRLVGYAGRHKNSHDTVQCPLSKK